MLPHEAKFMHSWFITVISQQNSTASCYVQCKYDLIPHGDIGVTCIKKKQQTSSSLQRYDLKFHIVTRGTAAAGTCMSNHRHRHHTICNLSHCQGTPADYVWPSAPALCPCICSTIGVQFTWRGHSVPNGRQ